MEAAFREVGVAQELGKFTSGGTTYNASMVTQNFAKSGSKVFLTGVAYSDRDNDDFYSIGEGVSNVKFTIGSNSAKTIGAGGYSLSVKLGIRCRCEGDGGIGRGFSGAGRPVGRKREA